MTSNEWRTLPLKAFLSRTTDPVNVEDSTVYEQVTVRIRGRGLASRGFLAGEKIGTKRQNRVHTGQLLVSKIDARNGAFGIVPDALDDAIVTQDFPTYVVDTSIVDLGFVGLLTASPSFWAECEAASEGTTNRVRLNLDEFLEIEVDVPSVDEQRGIVRLVRMAEVARERYSRERDATEALLAALREELIGDNPADEVPLSEVVPRIEAGKSPKAADRPPHADEPGVLKVSAIRAGEFRENEAKALSDASQFPQRALVREGDVLIGRANTRQLVGAVCRVEPGVRGQLYLCDKTLRLCFDADSVDPDFLVHAMTTVGARHHIEESATGTSDSMKNISQGAILETSFPLPALDEQRNIAAELESVRRHALIMVSPPNKPTNLGAL